MISNAEDRRDLFLKGNRQTKLPSLDLKVLEIIDPLSRNCERQSTINTIKSQKSSEDFSFEDNSPGPSLRKDSVNFNLLDNNKISKNINAVPNLRRPLSKRCALQVSVKSEDDLDESRDSHVSYNGSAAKELNITDDRKVINDLQRLKKLKIQKIQVFIIIFNNFYILIIT